MISASHLFCKCTGYFSHVDDLTHECYPCPDGAFCMFSKICANCLSEIALTIKNTGYGGSNLTALDGYWQAPDSYAFYPCLESSNCVNSACETGCYVCKLFVHLFL